MVGRDTAVLGLTGAPTKAPAPVTAHENYSISYCRLKHKNINKQLKAVSLLIFMTHDISIYSSNFLISLLA